MTRQGPALLADVGGTNTRVALWQGGRLIQPQRFANDAAAGLLPLLASYLHEAGAPPLSAAALAIAGPVGPGPLRLTNRDWVIDRAALIAALGLPGASALRCLNDLEALALALPGLAPAQRQPLRDGSGPGNGQALVLNLGTGVNAGLVRRTQAGPVAWALEFGHAALPAPVQAALGPGAGEAAPPATMEALFSAAGLGFLCRQAGGEMGPPEAILARAAAAEGPARQAALRMARLLGQVLQQLVWFYLPLDGIVLAGSLARALIGWPEGRAACLDAFDAPAEPGAGVALALILDDAAALTGLAAALPGVSR
ncbi:glucokinase [Pseudodonghicola flavimaris]|uniref:Glucokinase n=1 Tax=Pseudodonghicola flavimaris TaxID=3050036 RepID=A0ABT7F3I5_9RHOB|nr:glucokinase [Pseudodonghicola flavimaris]MDK3019166.1 glucokinase [Pseudodonghicola flavimaris]